MSNTEWPIDIDTVSKLDKPTLEFILKEADKSLKDSIDIRSNISQRFTTLAVLVVGLIGAVIAKWLTDFNDQSFMCKPDMFFMLLFAFVYLIIVCFYILRQIKGINYSPYGREPNYILKGIQKDNITIKDQVYKDLLCQEIAICQNRILKNNKVNEDSWAAFYTALKALAIFPIATMLYFASVSYLFFFYLAPH